MGLPSGHVVTADELGVTMTDTDYVVCTSNVTVSTTEAVVTGMSSSSVTAVTSSSTIKVVATLQFSATTGASTNLQGRLYVDGTQQTGTINENLPNTGDLRTSTKIWTITGLAAGSHTIQMRTAKSSGVGTHVILATNSCMDISVFE